MIVVVAVEVQTTVVTMVSVIAFNGPGIKVTNQWRMDTA